MSSRPEVDLHLVVMGPHLSPEFGSTVRQIEEDGFDIAARIECLLSSDSDVGMAKTIGLATLSLTDLFAQMRPDLLLLIADRYEMLAPASVALSLRIPMAHIEGGEISEGAIDEAVRNALTKMAHIHFTSTEQARQRVIAMGEEEWRVHKAGAPSLDHLRRRKLLSRKELEHCLHVKFQSSPIVVGFHPMTIAKNTLEEADALFTALKSTDGQILFCYPNADAGSRLLIERAKAFLERRQHGAIWINLAPLVYWSLLSHVDLLLGNSSSGIMETPSLRLPTVNIGLRQHGREQACNVLNAPADSKMIAQQIQRARSEEFRISLKGMVNPYGDGHASERITEVLATVPFDNLLRKRSMALGEWANDLSQEPPCLSANRS